MSSSKQRRSEPNTRVNAIDEESHARWLRLVGAVVVVVAIGAVIAVANSLSDDTAESKGGEAAEATFGPHYSGLQARRERAGVSTEGAPTASAHTHPHLSVWANGKQVHVPADIGIDPQRPPTDMASLHTHTPDGTIHNEGQADPTLGMFFAVWGVALSPNRLGPYLASQSKAVQMWVDGKPSWAFAALKLRDRQRIVVSFGKPSARPPQS